MRRVSQSALVRRRHAFQLRLPVERVAAVVYLA
jgi:hypothetical protein